MSQKEEFLIGAANIIILILGVFGFLGGLTMFGNDARREYYHQNPNNTAFESCDYLEHLFEKPNYFLESHTHRPLPSGVECLDKKGNRVNFTKKEQR